MFIDLYFITKITDENDIARLLIDELCFRLAPFDDIDHPDAREFARTSFINQFMSDDFNMCDDSDLYNTTYLDYLKQLKFIRLNSKNSNKPDIFYTDFPDECSDLCNLRIDIRDYFDINKIQTLVKNEFY